MLDVLMPAALFEIRLQSIPPIGPEKAQGGAEKKAYGSGQNEFHGRPTTRLFAPLALPQLPFPRGSMQD
jgi:hypothetical protein